MTMFNAQVKATGINLAFDKLPEALRNRLAITIRELTNQLLAEVKAGEPRRTGRLQSMTQSFVDVRDGFVRGRVRVLRSVSANAAAAAGALEYGAPGRRGAFRVAAYRRRQTEVFGRPNRSLSGLSVAVSSYTRRAHIREMRFLRNPAAAMLPRARLALEAAVAEAIKDTMK
jgi:hypothetical protein